MLKWSKLAAVLAVGLMGFMWGAPAQAQATRTWVSGVGDDANPCSRTAPCKTFAGAISKTASSGEIDCLDPGGFGSVTITKSISIKCDRFSQGGIVSPGVSGVNVNIAGGFVVLDGLNIEGVGTGINGINILAAASVTIENCEIRDFNSATGYGISATPSAALVLNVINTSLLHNGGASVGGALLAKPNSGGSISGFLQGIMVGSNTSGLNLNTTNAGSGIVKLAMSDSVVAGGNVGVGAVAAGTQSAVVITHSVIQGATLYGLYATGNKAVAAIGYTQLNGNATAVNSDTSGLIVSFGTNAFGLNTNDGTISATVGVK